MLEAVKAYLKIEWDAEDTNITGIIERGKAYINSLTGTELDFESESPARSLLLDYCRYAYNNALEYYAENFSADILRLQLSEGVKAMPEEEVT